jgi:O-antigen/teichoic acid export membrane protein
VSAPGFLAQALMVVSSALLARMLGPVGRGELAVVQVIAIVLTQVVMGGLVIAVAVSIAEAKAPARDVLRGHARRLLGWSVVASATSALATLAFLHATDEWALLAVAGFLTTFLLSEQLLTGAMLQGENRAWPQAKFRYVGSATYVGAVVVIYFVLPVESAAVLLLMLVPIRLLAILPGLRSLRRPEKSAPSRVSWSDLRSRARRSRVAGAQAMVLGLDQLLVSIILSAASVGLYSVAVMITNLPMMALTGVAGLMRARVAAAPPERKRHTVLQFTTIALAICVLVVVLLELVLAPAIRIILGSEFEPATTTARILAVTWGLLAMRTVFSSALQGLGRERLTSYTELVGTVVMLGAVSVGAQYGGIEGAAWGFGAAAFLAFAVLSISTGFAVRNPHEQRASEHGQPAPDLLG